MAIAFSWCFAGQASVLQKAFDGASDWPNFTVSRGWAKIAGEPHSAAQGGEDHAVRLEYSAVALPDGK
jgi:hypothetical protein